MAEVAGPGQVPPARRRQPTARGSGERDQWGSPATRGPGWRRPGRRRSDDRGSGSSISRRTGPTSGLTTPACGQQPPRPRPGRAGPRPARRAHGHDARGLVPPRRPGRGPGTSPSTTRSRRRRRRPLDDPHLVGDPGVARARDRSRQAAARGPRPRRPAGATARRTGAAGDQRHQPDTVDRADGAASMSAGAVGHREPQERRRCVPARHRCGPGLAQGGGEAGRPAGPVPMPAAASPERRRRRRRRRRRPPTASRSPRTA